ncbi:MAG: DUF5615 family PIN-like protein [bacterium]
MVLFAADEDFNNKILRGLFRRNITIDIVRIQDIEFQDRSDPSVLEWCAGENRIILTHDVNTLIKHALNRIESKQKMPGVISVHQQCPIGKAIEDLVLIIKSLRDDEYKNKIIFVPL